jgi:hypothetical protein
VSVTRTNVLLSRICAVCRNTCKTPKRLVLSRVFPAALAALQNGKCLKVNLDCALDENVRVNDDTERFLRDEGAPRWYTMSFRSRLQLLQDPQLIGHEGNDPHFHVEDLSRNEHNVGACSLSVVRHGIGRLGSEKRSFGSSVGAGYGGVQLERDYDPLKSSADPFNSPLCRSRPLSSNRDNDLHLQTCDYTHERVYPSCVSVRY